MATPRENLLDWLRDAHAMKQQAESTIQAAGALTEAFIERSQDPNLEAKKAQPSLRPSLALNPIRMSRFYRSYLEGRVMYEDRKANALETWQ